MMISGTFKDNEEISQMLSKSVIAYVLHKTFDKETYFQLTVGQLVESVRSANLEKKLFVALKEAGISLLTPELQKAEAMIDRQLHECLSGNLSNKSFL